MLLRYTEMTPSVIRSYKISFIIIWKVARLLVRPKYMTRGSNKPLLVWNAAFCQGTPLDSSSLLFVTPFSLYSYSSFSCARYLLVVLVVTVTIMVTVT
jgi:hypothetical protein